MSESIGQTGRGEVRDKPPALWRALVEGSAGVGVRVGISLAAAPLLAGVGLVLSFVVTGIITGWDGLWVRDEMIAIMFVLMALAYLLVLIWIWTRGQHRLRDFWRASLFTVMVVLAAISLSIFFEVDRTFRGGTDAMVAALLCFGGTGIILIWIQAGRRYALRRPVKNAQGRIDVRCPSCGYSMIGLQGTRCPECGGAFTLDDLIQRQKFLIPPTPEATLAASAERSTDGNGSHR